jgi:hypothetical protein
MKRKIVRFIERDYHKKRMLVENDSMTEAQADAILDRSEGYWVDYTFTFYENGSMTIIDNDTEATVPLKDLKGPAYDFYVKQRIQLIRTTLQEKILQSA